MLNVFDLHLSTPEEKAVSIICASKTRRNLQTFGWCLQFKQSCRGLHYLTFVCGKQSRENQYNGACRVKEKCLRKAQHYQSSFEGGEGPLQIEFTNIATKKPQPLL
jgi:hypothetical protein